MSGVLRIPYAEKSDEGEYECSGRNYFGTHAEVTRVIVREGSSSSSMRPAINPSYFNGRTGEQFTLTCTANGPQREIKWSKERGYLPNNSRQNNGVLFVVNARPEDSGRYICTVTDFFGTSGIETASVTIADYSGYVKKHTKLDSFY